MPIPIDKLAIWLGGFFDGEGAIMIMQIKRNPDGRSDTPYYYDLRLDVSNTQLEILEFIKANFGGRLVGPHGTRTPNGKPVHHWIAIGNAALKVLARIYPYLFLKRERAKLAIEFQLSRNAWLKLPSLANKLTAEELERRRKAHITMKQLNMKGVKSNAVDLTFPNPHTFKFEYDPSEHTTCNACGRVFKTVAALTQHCRWRGRSELAEEGKARLSPEQVKRIAERMAQQSKGVA